jgi:G:T-mismatch repair DNA endonuclease (very short patch repair protein)
VKAEKKSNTESDITQRARRLLADPAFLFKVGRKIRELGVVGEERNRLILFLAGVTRVLPNPATIIIRGSSGKSSLVTFVSCLFHHWHVCNVNDLGDKKTDYRLGALDQNILLIDDYTDHAKDKRLLMSLLRAQGGIYKNFEWESGEGKPDTVRTNRMRCPVVLFTTRDDTDLKNEESRFLSLQTDESPAQTLAIVKSRAQGLKLVAYDKDLELWEQATNLLVVKRGDFENHPNWLSFVAEQLPVEKVAVRRAWARFVTFCCAIALCRGIGAAADRMVITLPDYCVAYRIFEPVFASELHGIRLEELRVARTIAKLNNREGRPVTVREIAAELQADERLISDQVISAQKSGLVSYESGTGKKKEEGLVAREDAPWSFVPAPKTVLKNHPALGPKVSYVDPFSGDVKWIEA